MSTIRAEAGSTYGKVVGPVRCEALNLLPALPEREVGCPTRGVSDRKELVGIGDESFDVI